MTANPVRILLISGSLRAGAGSTSLLQTVPGIVDPADVRADMYFGMAALPHFNPDDDFAPVHPAVAQLRGAIAEADALLFATPEYAGNLPGSFKNLLDWTVGSDDIGGKPSACLNTAAPGRGDGADAALRGVLGYTGADIVADASVRIPVGRDAIDTEHGTVADPDARKALAAAVETLAAYVRGVRP
ncbi:MAG: NAD(P)H-dependent oxidoreductase [Streptomycetaceae bacterium]|jgi:NAD(P)H-dependent FMN reductase|nr:NAD(P)H-dependent oxidoreductase [Streptomycetaceae bacterium]NUS54321.1 NAD(P)H-dependent oxidoreductase [Streptomycetaceae bacterium]